MTGCALRRLSVRTAHTAAGTAYASGAGAQLRITAPERILALRKTGRGHHKILERIFRRHFQNGLARRVFQGIGLAAALLLRELEHRIGLIAAVHRVIHIAAGDHDAAVDVNAVIRIQSGIRTVGAGCCNDHAAVDDQPAIGIDAIALAGLPGHFDSQRTAVDGCDGYTVLIGIDTVIPGQNVNISAVDRQVQLRIQTLVVRHDLQRTRSGLAAADVHGHLGVQRTIVLMEFLGLLHRRTVRIQRYALRLVDFRHMRACDAVFRTVCSHNVRAGGGGIHRLRGGLHIC